MQLLHAHVCAFIPWCKSPQLQPGGTSTGQIPLVPSGAQWGAGSWCLPPFPHALSKSSWPRDSASWLGFCLGKVMITTSMLVLCLVWQGGRNLCWVTGTCQFLGYEGDVVPMQKLLFSQPVARGCPLWAMEGALCSCWGCLHPLALRPSVKHRLWRKDHPSGCRKLQIIPCLC